MLHSQRVMTNFGRKPRIHSGVDVIRHSMVSLERYIPPALYRRLFIQRIARHPLAIEGRVTAVTRQLITVEADFRHDDGELIARAAAQQILMPKL